MTKRASTQSTTGPSELDETKISPVVEGMSGENNENRSGYVGKVVVEREVSWLKRTVAEAPKSPKWIGATANKKRGSNAVKRMPRVVKMQPTVYSSAMSPLKPVGNGTQKASFGRRKYTYNTTRSEGNRFIKNSDL